VRRDDLYEMPVLLKVALLIEGASASLDADETRLEFGNNLHESVSTNPSLKNAAALPIDAVKLEDIPCQINPKRMYPHYQPPSSVWPPIVAEDEGEQSIPITGARSTRADAA
jgi:hypothetical protein